MYINIMNNLDIDIDLNIKNYELKDIVNLFKIPIVFNESHLRAAKIMVLHTHPDKSNLPKEYFLFYSSAYKILYQIYTFRSGQNKTNQEKYSEILNQEQNTQTKKGEEDSAQIYINKLKTLEPNEFNKLFNEQYDKCKIQMDEEQGYGDWFRSNEDTNENENENEGEKKPALSSWDERMTEINKKKQQLRDNLTIVSINDIQTVSNGCAQYYQLGQGVPSEHSSGVFSSSSLQYEDLKKAHTETVIPVTHEDFTNLKKFGSVNELQTFRDVHSKSFDFNNDNAVHEQYKMDEDNTRRAYIMTKQDEIAQQMNKMFSGSFLNSIMN